MKGKSLLNEGGKPDKMVISGRLQKGAVTGVVLFACFCLFIVLVVFSTTYYLQKESPLSNFKCKVLRNSQNTTKVVFLKIGIVQKYSWCFRNKLVLHFPNCTIKLNVMRSNTDVCKTSRKC